MVANPSRKEASPKLQNMRLWSSSAAGKPLPSNAGTHVVPATLCASSLGRILSPDSRALRARVHDLLREDVFRPRYGEDLAAERRRCWDRMKRLVDVGLFKGTLTSTGAELSEAAERYGVVVMAAAQLDHSLEVKIGVSFGLFGTTVKRLGTEEQARKYLPDVEALREVGCFALTGSSCNIFYLPHGVLVEQVRASCVSSANFNSSFFNLVSPSLDAFPPSPFCASDVSISLQNLDTAATCVASKR